MFIGHLGVGLALKKAEPQFNLGGLFLAVMLPDVMLWLFVLAAWSWCKSRQTTPLGAI